MRHHLFHELAKFASGLILGDFIAGWWFSAHNLFPMSFLGVTLTASMIGPWLAFDAALFLILVHYGWNVGRTPHLSGKGFFTIIGIIFGIVALLHFVRLIFGVTLVFGTFEVPLWLSWIGAAATAYLSYMSFYLAGRKS